MNTLLTKQCTTCKRTLELSQFNKNKSRSDGLAGQCRTCTTEANKQYRRHLPAEKKVATLPAQRKRQKKLTLEKRLLVLAYAAQHGCIDCGEKDPIVLEYDHVDGSKIAAISRLVSQNASIDVIRAEIEKCEIRCANCHRRRTTVQLNRYSDVDFSTLSGIDTSRLQSQT